MKKLNNVIDQVETESQASATNRRNEVIEILESYEQQASFRAFRMLYGSVAVLVAVILGGIVTQHFVVDLSWGRDLEQTNNPLFLVNTLYQVQLQTSRIISKSLSIYGIDKGIISEADFGALYGSNSYKQDAREHIQKTCLEVK